VFANATVHWAWAHVPDPSGPQSEVTVSAAPMPTTIAVMTIRATFSQRRSRKGAGRAVQASTIRKTRTIGKSSALKTSTAIARPTNEPLVSTSTAERPTAPVKTP